MADRKNFDRAALESALAELGRRAFEVGRTVEIAIYGGSALLLTLNREITTGDVDAVFEKDKTFIKKLAADMAEELGWDENWLNDGVKGWLSARDADPDVPNRCSRPTRPRTSLACAYSWRNRNTCLR